MFRQIPLMIGAALCLAAVAASPSSRADDTNPLVANKCNKCHRVRSLDIAPVREKKDIVNLDGVGAKYDRAFFEKWLLHETDKDSVLKPGGRVKHKRPKWSGSDADLQKIIDVLVTLKKK